jgi:hypothetical protein
MFIITSYICAVPIGFNLPYSIAMGIGVALAVAYSAEACKKGVSMREGKIEVEAVPVFS